MEVVKRILQVLLKNMSSYEKQLAQTNECTMNVTFEEEGRACNPLKNESELSITYTMYKQCRLVEN